MHLCLHRATLAAQDEKVHELTNEQTHTRKHTVETHTHTRDLLCTSRQAVLAVVLVTNV